MKPIKEIASVNQITENDFNKNYLNPSLPVVLRGAAKGSEAFKKWSDEYFIKVCGKKVVEIRFSKNGVYNYHKGEVDIKHLPFDEAVKYLKENNSYYIQQASIFKDYPELATDLVEPEFIKEKDLDKQINLWFGGAGCVSPLHYDGFQNFLVQIMGRKELILFAPSDIEFLYPNLKGPRTLRQISLINLDNPDLNLYPLLNEAQPYKVVLNPGDILFIPLNWWHHVRSLDLSISVNYWFSRLNIKYLKQKVKLITSHYLGK